MAASQAHLSPASYRDWHPTYHGPSALLTRAKASSGLAFHSLGPEFRKGLSNRLAPWTEQALPWKGAVCSLCSQRGQALDTTLEGSALCFTRQSATSSPQTDSSHLGMN